MLYEVITPVITLFNNRLHQHHSVFHARRKYCDVHVRILEAPARSQAEVLLVDGRSHDKLALQVAHDPA